MPTKSKKFRNIYFINSVETLEALKPDLKIQTDLVLTENFSVKHKTILMGGDVLYFQNLLEPEISNRNNFHVQAFFENWHKDRNGQDLFTFKDVHFGLSFRIFIWTELFEFVRIYMNLNVIKKLNRERVILTKECFFLAPYLNSLLIKYELAEEYTEKKLPKLHHYFVNASYMSGALTKPNKVKYFLYKMLDIFVDLKNNLALVLPHHKSKQHIISQLYHPTTPIVSELSQRKGIHLLTTSLMGTGVIRRYLKANYIPSPYFHLKDKKAWKRTNSNFLENKHAKMILEENLDLTQQAYTLIESVVFPRTREAIGKIRKIEKYQRRHPIDLEIQFSNLGFSETLVSCVLMKHNVSSYIVQNGLQTHRFGDEGKFATYINAYGLKIAENYFRSASNVFALGDPRMDKYFSLRAGKTINRTSPTIGIGSSAFNSIDLNSHTAIEFEFLFDVLMGISSNLIKSNYDKIVIKVRPNCVLRDYETFIQEYFPTLKIVLVQNQPMEDYLSDIDLYISIYSQTLFEASCLGIPVIYYKRDHEFHYPPFDGKSEIQTAVSINDLDSLLDAFTRSDACFEKFLSIETMEKYLGNLRGEALKLNLEFIDRILAKAGI
jgi:hypothetical protein